MTAQFPNSIAHELRAREIAFSLRASGVPSGYLVSSTRSLLSAGQSTRDAQVIAGARKLQRQTAQACASQMRRMGREQEAREIEAEVGIGADRRVAS